MPTCTLWVPDYRWGASQVALVVKSASAWDARDTGSIPGSGRSPGGGHGNPLQYSCREIPWTEELGGLQSMGSQRPKHSWRDLARMITAEEKGSLASFHSGHSNFIPVLCKALGWALVIQRWWSTWRGRSMSSSSWFLKHCLLGRSQPKLDGRPEIWPQFHSVRVIRLCQDHLTSVFP